MQFDAVYCVMEKRYFKENLDIIIAKAISIDGLNFFFHFILIPICIL